MGGNARHEELRPPRPTPVVYFYGSPTAAMPALRGSTVDHHAKVADR
jgi:hypothetical protein